MSKGRSPSIDEQIVKLLYAEGPMDCHQLAKKIPFKYKSISTKCLDLERNDLIERDEDRVWSLKKGVTPQTLVTGDLQEYADEEAVEEGDEPKRRPPPIARSAGAPLDQRDMFIKHMVDIGVSPREAIPTITDIFFSGDITSLKWLNKVLSQDAQGYVTHQNRRLMMSWWANTRQLEFDEEDYGFHQEGEGKGKKGGGKAEKEPPAPIKPLDPGMGWRVDKDRAGDWVAIPGGPMTYEDAIAAAERRHLISQYGGGAQQEGAGEGDDGEEGQPGRRRAKPQESFMEKMMLRVFDNMLDGGKGKSSEESETVKRLTERIENMEKERQEERFERLEGMLAGIAARDPWDEYDKIESMKQRLGVGGPMITDQSPAVQLIKDTSEKMDKNVNRLVGIIEKAALKSEEFSPEETRSPQERESKAGELLSEVQSRDRSRALRRSTFNV